MANVKEVYPPVPECGGLTCCKSNGPPPARHSLSDAVKNIVAHDVRSAPQRKRRERLVTSAATRTIRHVIIQQQIREPETHVVAIPEGDQASKPRVASSRATLGKTQRNDILPRSGCGPIDEQNRKRFRSGVGLSSRGQTPNPRSG
jgi:hypothetical protein